MLKSIGTALLPRLKLLAILIVLFVVIQPLVSMPAPWFYIHAAITIYIRMYVLGRLF